MRCSTGGKKACPSGLEPGGARSLAGTGLGLGQRGLLPLAQSVPYLPRPSPPSNPDTAVGARAYLCSAFRPEGPPPLLAPWPLWRTLSRLAPGPLMGPMLGIAMDFIQIAVEHREEKGKGPVRRLRRAGKVPGVLYGLGRRNLPLTIPQEEVDRFLKTGSHLVELRMGDDKRQAIIREVQYHPLNDEILHIDFNRVDENVEIETNVVIEWKGEAPGTKEGGVFQGIMETIHVRSRPADLPRIIIIEIDTLELGDSIHLADVALPDRVAAVGADDALVCQVVMPKVTAEETEEEEEEEAAAEGGEGAPTADA